MTTSDISAKTMPDTNQLVSQLLSDSLSPLFWPLQRCSQPTAWATHIPFAHWIMVACKPRIFVELGTHTGASYAAFCQAVAKAELDTRCYAIDTWEGDEHAGYYSEEVFADLYAFNAKHYASFSELLKSTFDNAQPFFEDGSVDLLHIDGLHTYEAVRHDFDTWRSKLSPHGVILFHDTNVRQSTFGVWKVFEEEEKKYPSFHFLHGHGLGVLAVGEHAPRAILDLCALSTTEVSKVRKGFAFFGMRCADAFATAGATAAKTTQEEKRLQSEVRAVSSRLRAEAKQAAEMTRRLAVQRLATPASTLPADVRGRLFSRDRAKRKELLSAYKDVSHSPLFDSRWYLDAYKNVSAQGEDPVHHFIKFANEYNLDPGPYFSTRAYLEANPDVKKKGENALLHYIRVGANENRPLGYLRRNVDEEENYLRWIRECDTLSLDDKALIRLHIRNFRHRPKISVVMPVYDTPAMYLRASIQSVINQLYADWELCIADDASPSSHVVEILEDFASRDSRIKWVRRDVNGHISAATNSALELASGEFVALLDHDDILAEQALYEVVNEINQHPDADLIYSDEDHIDDDDRRSNPYFKTDFNPDLILGQNMISHFGVYRHVLIKNLGGMREGLEGSQDYDLALRTVDSSSRDRIRHIPAVLYHWRQHFSGSSFSGSHLERCLSSARRAVADTLLRRGQKGTVEEDPQTGAWQRVRRPCPSPTPLVSIIVTTKGRVLRPPGCIESLLKLTDYPNIEVLIAGPARIKQKTLDIVQGFDGEKRTSFIDAADNLSASTITNAVARAATGSFIALVDSEVEVISPEWLTEMVSIAALPNVGAVGARLLYRDGRLDNAGIGIGLNGTAGALCRFTERHDPGYFARAAMVSTVSAVSGACLVVNKGAFGAVGGFDEVRLPSAFNDIDFCLRLQEKGYRNVFTPYAELYRFQNNSKLADLSFDQSEIFEAEAAYFKGRWSEQIKRDPFYNPNLSLFSDKFELAFPSRRPKPWML